MNYHISSLFFSVPALHVVFCLFLLWLLAECVQTIMTARQLLSILRLSQSLARIRFLEGVTSEEVDEVIIYPRV